MDILQNTRRDDITHYADDGIQQCTYSLKNGEIVLAHVCDIYRDEYRKKIYRFADRENAKMIHQHHMQRGDEVEALFQDDNGAWVVSAFLE